MLSKSERTAPAPRRAQVAQRAIAPKETTARLSRLVRRLGAARQSLVVAHDVMIATLSLPSTS